MEDSNFPYCEILNRQIDGESIVIPSKLASKLPTLSRKASGRDIIALIWLFLDQATSAYRTEKDLLNREKEEKEFVPIHSDRFKIIPASRNTVWKYKKILSDLKLLEVNHSYQTKKKAKGYRLVNTGQLVEYMLETDLSPSDLYDSETKPDPRSKQTRRNLNQLTLKQSLLCPTFATIMWSNIMDQNKPPEIGWGLEKIFWKSHRQVYPVIKIIHQKGRIGRDFTGRLHSPFTQLKSELRGVFEVDGEELYGVDMQAAQPTLLSYRCGDVALLEDCKKDLLYAKIMRLTGLDRAQAKKRYAQFSYGDNRRKKTKKNQYAFAIKDLFQSDYPIAAQYLWSQKEEQKYEKVAHDMMREESALFIDGAMNVLDENKIFALSVHDGIYFRESDKKKARNLILETLKSGIQKRFKLSDTPVLKIDETRPAEVRQMQTTIEN